MQKNNAGTLAASNSSFYVQRYNPQAEHATSEKCMWQSIMTYRTSNCQTWQFIFYFKMHDGIKHTLSPMPFCELPTPFPITTIMKSVAHSLCIIKAVRNISAYCFLDQIWGIYVQYLFPWLTERRQCIQMWPNNPLCPTALMQQGPHPVSTGWSPAQDDAQWILFTSPSSLDHGQRESRDERD